MPLINHNEIERSLQNILRVFSKNEDFDFKYPIEVNASEHAVMFGIEIHIALYDEPFYFQIRFGDNKNSQFMQVAIKFMIGDLHGSAHVTDTVNRLNSALLYGKAILSSDEEQTFLTIDRDFSAINMDQVAEEIYDFFGDLIDQDVSPLINELVKQLI